MGVSYFKKERNKNMNKLIPVEMKDQRVLTTQQLAEVYETDVNNIKNNFNNHKDKFIEGTHYYLLQGEGLKAFRLQVNDIDLQISAMTRSLYLWTERGASRHCKILDTKKAWEQFDYLEDTYFKVKEHKKLSAIEMMKLQSQAIYELDERIDTLEEKIEKHITLDCGKQRTLQNSVSQRAYERAGQVFPKEIKQNVGRFFQAIYKDLKNRFGVASYRDININDYSNAIAYVSTWIEPAEVRN